MIFGGRVHGEAVEQHPAWQQNERLMSPGWQARMTLPPGKPFNDGE
jgi:hypothetical protein